MVRGPLTLLAAMCSRTKPSIAPPSQLRCWSPHPVGDVVGARAVRPRVEVPRVEHATVRRIAWLGEDAGPGRRVLEPAHAPVDTEIVVERAVLLDQDHHMPDALQTPARRGGGKRPGDERPPGQPCEAQPR